MKREAVWPWEGEGVAGGTCGLEFFERDSCRSENESCWISGTCNFVIYVLTEEFCRETRS